MRKMIGLTLVLTLVLTAFAAAPASAGLIKQIDKWDARAVSVDHSSAPCSLLDGNGDVVAGDRTKFTFANRYILTCVANPVANDTGRRVVFNYGNFGEMCIGENGDETKKWRNVVTRNGFGILVCKFKD